MECRDFYEIQFGLTATKPIFFSNQLFKYVKYTIVIDESCHSSFQTTDDSLIPHKSYLFVFFFLRSTCPRQCCSTCSISGIWIFSTWRSWDLQTSLHHPTSISTWMAQAPPPLCSLTDWLKHPARAVPVPLGSAAT